MLSWHKRNVVTRTTYYCRYGTVNGLTKILWFVTPRFLLPDSLTKQKLVVANHCVECWHNKTQQECSSNSRSNNTQIINPTKTGKTLLLFRKSKEGWSLGGNGSQRATHLQSHLYWSMHLYWSWKTWILFGNATLPSFVLLSALFIRVPVSDLISCRPSSFLFCRPWTAAATR